jgi:hypothetical protein
MNSQPIYLAACRWYSATEISNSILAWKSKNMYLKGRLVSWASLLNFDGLPSSSMCWIMLPGLRKGDLGVRNGVVGTEDWSVGGWLRLGRCVGGCGSFFLVSKTRLKDLNLCMQKFI